MPATDTKIKSLQKAMTVLECFSAVAPELGLTEIAHMTGYQKSTVHNILSSFKAMGYVEQDGDSSRYQLAMKLLRFSHVINSHMQLQNTYQPYLKKIVDALHERAYLAVMYNDEVLYLDSWEYQGHPNSASVMGNAAPLYCTGLGKVLLAFTDNPQAHLPATLTAFTSDTITDKAVLLQELKAVRLRRYAVDNMEHEFGVKCVAVPVFGAGKKVHVAVSVSGPSLRFADDDIPNIAKTLQSILEPLQYVK